MILGNCRKGLWPGAYEQGILTVPQKTMEILQNSTKYSQFKCLKINIINLQHGFIMVQNYREIPVIQTEIFLVVKKTIHNDLINNHLVLTKKLCLQFRFILELTGEN